MSLRREYFQWKDRRNNKQHHPLLLLLLPVADVALMFNETCVVVKSFTSLSCSFVAWPGLPIIIMFD